MLLAWVTVYNVCTEESEHMQYILVPWVTVYTTVRTHAVTVYNVCTEESEHMQYILVPWVTVYKDTYRFCISNTCCYHGLTMLVEDTNKNSHRSKHVQYLKFLLPHYTV